MSKDRNVSSMIQQQQQSQLKRNSQAIQKSDGTSQGMSEGGPNNYQVSFD